MDLERLNPLMDVLSSTMTVIDGISLVIFKIWHLIDAAWNTQLASTFHECQRQGDGHDPTVRAPAREILTSYD